jgi:hypothetical protein
MVSDWLKLELLNQFFSLLAEDGANDKRRLKFWEHYHKSIRAIDDMYFALGSHARSNRSSDFVQLRKKMTGRVLNLNAGGPPRNNAFIMCIGDYVAVEFGVSGNACFIFEGRDLPFDLSRGAVAGDRSELKHDSHLERMLHIDSNAGPWEQEFERKLGRMIEGTSRGQRRAAGSQNSKATSVPYTRAQLDRFCLDRRLKIRDLTPQKGNLWVATDESDKSVNRQLSDWGFRYKINKGWFREHS